MESHRASPLLRSLTQLGGRTAGLLPEDPQLCSHHPNPNRTSGHCLSRPPILSLWSQTHTRSNCFPSIAAPRNSARMELHYQAATVNLFLRDSLEKLGPRTLQSQALGAEVVHGTPTRFSAPARFSFALGGKDGHPFPVPRKTYDETMRRSLEAAKLGNADKIDGLRRLDCFVQAVERSKAPSANFRETIARGRQISSFLDGMTAGSQSVRSKPATKQLSLF
jgi:hypothetical protein